MLYFVVMLYETLIRLVVCAFLTLTTSKRQSVILHVTLVYIFTQYLHNACVRRNIGHYNCIIPTCVPIPLQQRPSPNPSLNPGRNTSMQSTREPTTTTPPLVCPCGSARDLPTNLSGLRPCHQVCPHPGDKTGYRADPSQFLPEVRQRKTLHSQNKDLLRALRR